MDEKLSSVFQFALVVICISQADVVVVGKNPETVVTDCHLGNFYLLTV